VQGNSIEKVGQIENMQHFNKIYLFSYGTGKGKGG